MKFRASLVMNSPLMCSLSCDLSKCKDLACDMCRQLDTHDSPFIVQGSVPADTDRVSSVSRRLCHPPQARPENDS